MSTDGAKAMFLVQRFRGLSEVHVWIYWTAPLDSTSCRRLVIEMANARRCDGEGSPCKRWGLGISVKSKKWFSTSKGEWQYNRRRMTVQSKKNTSTIKGENQYNRRRMSVHSKTFVSIGSNTITHVFQNDTNHQRMVLFCYYIATNIEKNRTFWNNNLNFSSLLSSNTLWWSLDLSLFETSFF